MMTLVLIILLLHILYHVNSHANVAGANRLYKTLGIDKSADETAIKKAYRKLAMKHHPDKNPNKRKEAEKKFKEINEAYEILSDKQMKQAYDMYGEDALGPGGVTSPSDTQHSFRRGSSPFGNPHYSGSEGFNQFPGAGFEFQFPGGAGSSSRQYRAPKSDMFDGVFMNGNMGDMLNEMFGQFFPSQDSSRPQSRDSPFSSSESRSRSSRSNQRDSYARNFQPIRASLNCTLQDLYTGAVVQIPVTSDITVNGMRVPISRIIDIDIQKGWREGTKVTFPPTQDFPKSVVFTVKYVYRKQDYFRRHGDDLHWTCNLTKSQVTNGVVIRLPLLNGNVYEFDTKSLNIKSGYKHVFHGGGMPKSKSRGGGFGDVVVQFRVS